MMRGRRSFCFLGIFLSVGLFFTHYAYAEEDIQRLTSSEQEILSRYESYYLNFPDVEKDKCLAEVLREYQFLKLHWPVTPSLNIYRSNFKCLDVHSRFFSPTREGMHEGDENSSGGFEKRKFKRGSAHQNTEDGTVTKNFIEDAMGYIHISYFGEKTPRDFRNAMQSFSNSSGNSCVLIDVRDNPGGNLLSVLGVLHLFGVHPNDVMAFRRDRAGFFSYTVKSFSDYLEGKGEDPSVRGELSGYKIVVLINRRSASASEIFAGTMSDWGEEKSNFLVVGEPSYGKGVGQTPFLISDGSIFLLTTFEFFVGNHMTPVHGRGVVPSLVLGDSRGSQGETRTEADLQFSVAKAVLQEMCKSENSAAE